MIIKVSKIDSYYNSEHFPNIQRLGKRIVILNANNSVYVFDGESESEAKAELELLIGAWAKNKNTTFLFRNDRV